MPSQRRQGLWLLSWLWAFIPYGLAAAGPTLPKDTLITPIDQPIRSLMPLTTPDTSTEPAAALIFESLLEPSWEDESLRANLANRYQIEDGGLTIRFWLDPSARFHDGQPVTAADVKFSYDLLDLEGVNAEPWASHYLFVKHVEVVTPGEVRFHLHNASYANFRAIATMRIYSKSHYLKLYAADKSLSQGNAVQKPMGSGPWRIVSMTDQELRFARHETYWAKERHQREGRWNYQQRILRRLDAGVEQRVKAMNDGNLSFAPMTPSQWRQVNENKMLAASVDAVAAPPMLSQAYDAIVWNFRHPSLYTASVRWAMSQLVDLTTWCQEFDKGMTVPAVSPFGAFSAYRHPAVKTIAFAPEAAAARLEQAGLKLNQQDKRRYHGQQPVSIDIIFAANGEGHYPQKLADLSQKALSIGITITPIALAWDTMQDRLRKGQFGGAVLTWTRPMDLDFSRQFHPDSAKELDNYGHAKDNRVSKALQDFQASITGPARNKLGQDLDHALYAAQAYTMLSQYKNYYYLKQKSIITPRPIFANQIGLAFWRLK